MIEHEACEVVDGCVGQIVMHEDVCSSLTLELSCGRTK